MFKIFRKNRTKLVSADYFCVIKASEIAEMEVPPFNQSHWAPENEYRSYLESVQSLFEEYACNGSFDDLMNYDYHSIDEAIEDYERRHILNMFKSNFFSLGDRINVERSINGKYRVLDNGRHRMYVAKKYGLNILVHVSRIEIIE